MNIVYIKISIFIALMLLILACDFLDNDNEPVNTPQPSPTAETEILFPTSVLSANFNTPTPIPVSGNTPVPTIQPTFTPTITPTPVSPFGLEGIDRLSEKLTSLEKECLLSLPEKAGDPYHIVRFLLEPLTVSNEDRATIADCLSPEIVLDVYIYGHLGPNVTLSNASTVCISEALFNDSWSEIARGLFQEDRNTLEDIFAVIANCLNHNEWEIMGNTKGWTDIVRIETMCQLANRDKITSLNAICTNTPIAVEQPDTSYHITDGSMLYINTGNMVAISQIKNEQIYFGQIWSSINIDLASMKVVEGNPLIGDVIKTNIFGDTINGGFDVELPGDENKTPIYDWDSTRQAMLRYNNQSTPINLSLEVSEDCSTGICVNGDVVLSWQQLGLQRPAGTQEEIYVYFTLNVASR